MKTIIGIGGGLIYDPNECIFIHTNKHQETTAFNKKLVGKLVTSIKYHKSKPKEKVKKVKNYLIVLLDSDHKTLLQVSFTKKNEWLSATETLMSSDLRLFASEGYIPRPWTEPPFGFPTVPQDTLNSKTNFDHQIRPELVKY